MGKSGFEEPLQIIEIKTWAPTIPNIHSPHLLPFSLQRRFFNDLKGQGQYKLLRTKRTSVRKESSVHKGFHTYLEGKEQSRGDTNKKWANSPGHLRMFGGWRWDERRQFKVWCTPTVGPPMPSHALQSFSQTGESPEKENGTGFRK